MEHSTGQASWRAVTLAVARAAASTDRSSMQESHELLLRPPRVAYVE